MVGTRIAKAVALGLKIKSEEIVFIKIDKKEERRGIKLIFGRWSKRSAPFSIYQK